MPPRYPWGSDSFPEALFKDQRMAYEVRSDTMRINASKLSDERRTLSVRITHLSHCTHNEQARQIEGDDDYRRFKANMKTPRKNTRVCNIEERTKRKAGQPSVLPGYLSWWGISTVEWYESDDPRGNQTREIVSALKDSKTKETIYVPPYLQYPNEERICSVYGGISFSCSIRNLLESYQQSRNGKGQNNSIYFKKAGTLRYIHEICYVILVCTKEDLQNEDISSMPGAGRPDTREMTYFNLGDEFIARDGELKTMEITPEFISEYPIRAIYTYNDKVPKRVYSWDTLNFAFYFPEEQGQLKVESQHIQVCADIKHDEPSCHLGNCPDRHMNK